MQGVALSHQTRRRLQAIFPVELRPHAEALLRRRQAIHRKPRRGRHGQRRRAAGRSARRGGGFDAAIWDRLGKASRIPANPHLEIAGGKVIRASTLEELAGRIAEQAAALAAKRLSTDVRATRNVPVM